MTTVWSLVVILISPVYGYLPIRQHLPEEIYFSTLQECKNSVKSTIEVLEDTMQEYLLETNVRSYIPVCVSSQQTLELEV